MSYYMRLTAAGLAKIAAAEVGGPVISLTHIAVGDGNGNPVTPPTGAETVLVHEVYRNVINSLVVSPTDATMITAEMLIDSTHGNFAIHEIGIFDSTGTLFAYGNFPATWKPIATDGSTRDMIVHCAVKVSNSANITLVVDTSIVGATRQWVLNTITTAYLIPGGTVEQLLAKNSNTDGDFKWVSPGATFNYVVNAKKEIQTAAAGQDTFTLTTMTTTGTAVYVEGSREFDTTTLGSTQIKLSRTLPAGTRVMFVQNDPNAPFDLIAKMRFRGFFHGQT